MLIVLQHRRCHCHKAGSRRHGKKSRRLGHHLNPTTFAGVSSGDSHISSRFLLFFARSADSLVNHSQCERFSSFWWLFLSRASSAEPSGVTAPVVSTCAVSRAEPELGKLTVSLYLRANKAKAVAKPRRAEENICWLAGGTRVSTQSQPKYSKKTGMAAEAFCSFSLAAWWPAAANNFS
jgi:hypothetical protein